VSPATQLAAHVNASSHLSPQEQKQQEKTLEDPTFLKN